MSLLPTKLVPDEADYLLFRDKSFNGRLMIENIKVNLNEEESQGEDQRPSSPVQNTQQLFVLEMKVKKR